MADMEQQLADLSRDFRAHITENVKAHGQLYGTVERIEGKCDGIERELSRHGEEESNMRKALFGNGAAGFDERLRNEEAFTSNAKRIIWILVPAVIIGALSLLWSAIMFYLQQKGV